MPTRRISADSPLFSPMTTNQNTPLSPPSPAPNHLLDVEQLDDTLHEATVDNNPRSPRQTVNDNNFEHSTQTYTQLSTGETLPHYVNNGSSQAAIRNLTRQLTQTDTGMLVPENSPRTPDQPIIATFPLAPSRVVTNIYRTSEFPFNIQLSLGFYGSIPQALQHDAEPQEAIIGQTDNTQSDYSSPSPRESVTLASRINHINDREARDEQSPEANTAIAALNRVRRRLNIPQPEPTPIPVELAPGRPAGLNGTQINIIDGTIEYPIRSILELENLEDRLYVLNCILADVLTEQHSLDLTKLNILDDVTFIRQILEHPFPQNRSENYPYYGSPSNLDMVVFQVMYTDGVYRPGFETRGLLGLTARCDATYAPPTREHVVAHISMRINQQIEICEREVADRRSAKPGR